MHELSYVTLSVCQLRPESQGDISIFSADPHSYPSVKPNYLSTTLKKDTAVAGMRTARRLADAEAPKKNIAEEKLLGELIQSETDLQEAAGDISQTIYHPTSAGKIEEWFVPRL